jgi:hypothetical protein
VALNDVLGNYSLTLIDSLSTLAILASAPPDSRGTGPKALRDFQDGVAALVEQYGDGRPGPSGQGPRGRGFDVDSKVQVFETVIRGVGGLLSAHLFAVGELPITGYNPPGGSGGSLEDRPITWPNGLRYDGQLLRLALDLAQRLLPAFYTATGMPYPRVNLRTGIPFYANSPLHEIKDTFVAGDGAAEITETCSAGAGSLVLEFTVLSRLTGDVRFEQLAKRAFWAVWSRKSQIGLIGAGVDAEHGQWIGSYSVIGAGADSFFEYALKSYILLSGHDLPNRTSYRTDIGGEHWLDPNSLFPPLSDEDNSPDTFLEAWHHAHAAVKRHLYTAKDHPHYINVNLWTGSFAANWVDSLGAFYAGLLTMAGEVEEAIETNLLYTAIWTKYSALPERWSLRDKGVEGGLGWWPLRPEFIESTYHLYRATNDPWYLYVGEMVLRDITRRCWTPCGWAGLQNVLDGEKSDRMESFFLGETAKYMYLLFDDKHPLNSLDSAFVFTTEGHPLIIPRRIHTTKKPVRRRPAADVSITDITTYDEEEDDFKTTCPLPPKPHPLTYSATAARPDIYHAARLLDLHMTPNFNVNTTTLPGSSSGGQLSAKSNHTLFPWTLPPELLPDDGICAKVYSPVEMTLEFASTGNQATGGSAFNFMLGSQNLERLNSERLRVTSLSGLKMTFGLDEGDDPSWRLTKVNLVPLGRDEFVVMDRSILAEVSDQRFNLVRDAAIIKLQHLHCMDMSEGQNKTAEKDEATEYHADYAPEGESVAALAIESLNESTNHPATSRVNEFGSLVKSLLRQVMSSLDIQLPPSATPGPGMAGLPVDLPYNLVINQTAVMPTGPGAAPLPAVEVPPGLHVPDFGPAPASIFPWTTVYAAGDACGPAPLPDEVPRDHQIIVVRRGGCSFAEKLANIPAFVPDFRSLQLVVVVSDEEELGPDYKGYTEVAGGKGNIVRPLLEEPQRTPSGVLRRNPIAMVMVGGGDLAYQQLAMADKVGITRRYYVESGGVRVKNLIVDDGDAGVNI